MIRFWSICVNSFIQTIRQPVYTVLIVLAMVVLVLDMPLSLWALGTGSAGYHESNQKMLETLGVGTLLLSGVLIAGFSASRVLSREIEDRTAVTVISKPVWRGTFVLAKFAGVAIAVAAAFYLCSLVFLMTVRHKVLSAVIDPYDLPVIVLGLSAFALTLITATLGNLFFGWTFTSAGVCSGIAFFSVAMGLIGFIGKGWKVVPFGQDISGQLLICMLLTFMAVMILSAIAVAASTRLGQLMTLIVCGAALGLGSIHEYLFGRHAGEFPVVAVVGWVVPKLTYFFTLDALAMGKDIPMEYVAWTAAYSACYVTAVLALGVGLFQRRQLEAQAAAAIPGSVGLLAWAGRAVAVVLGIAAVALLFHAGYHNLRGFALAGALAAGAVAGWIVWSFFGRGAKWSYWLVLAGAAAALVQCLAALLFPGWRLGEPPERIFIRAMLAAVVLLILVLPKTHRHFQSTSRPVEEELRPH